MAGGKVLLSEGLFTVAAPVAIPSFVILEGHSIPATNILTPWGTTLRRTTDIVMAEIVGTDRSTDRRYGIGIRGINFDGTDAGTSDMLRASYLDQLTLEKVRFANGDGCNAVYAEECWDWRLYDTIFVRCGGVGPTKAGIYVYNGDDDFCNSWDLLVVRFQDPLGAAFYSDVGGAGGTNSAMRFGQCKFEGLAAGRPAASFVEGEMSIAVFNACDFNRAGVYHIDQPAGGSRYHIEGGCYFTNADQNSLRLQGDWNKVIGDHFISTANNPHIVLSGDRNVVTGNAKWDAAAKDLVADTGLGNIVQNNPGNLTDARITDPGDGGAIQNSLSGYVALVTVGGAQTRTLANPTHPGLTLDLFFQADAGDCVVTAAADVTSTPGEDVMTFANVDEHIRLVSIHMGGLRWRVVHNDGVVLS